MGRQKEEEEEDCHLFNSVAFITLTPSNLFSFRCYSIPLIFQLCVFLLLSFFFLFNWLPFFCFPLGVIFCVPSIQTRRMLLWTHSSQAGIKTPYCQAAQLALNMPVSAPAKLLTSNISAQIGRNILYASLMARLCLPWRKSALCTCALVRLCVSFWSWLSWDTQVGVFTLILEICIQWTWECNWIWKEGLPVAPSIPLRGVSGICEKNVPSWLILNSFGNLQNSIKQAHFEKKKRKNSSSVN